MTSTARASAGPVVWNIPNWPTIIDPRPMTTVAALAAMTAPMRRTVAVTAASHEVPETSSRNRETRKIV